MISRDRPHPSIRFFYLKDFAERGGTIMAVQDGTIVGSLMATIRPSGLLEILDSRAALPGMGIGRALYRIAADLSHGGITPNFHTSTSKLAEAVWTDLASVSEVTTVERPTGVPPEKWRRFVKRGLNIKVQNPIPPIGYSSWRDIAEPISDPGQPFREQRSNPHHVDHEIFLDLDAATQFAIDNTEGAAEDIADGEESIETFRGYAEQYIYYYRAAREAGRITAYRWLSVGPDDVDFHSVGEYWSAEEHAAGVLVGRSGKGTLLTALIPFESIDWLEGFKAFVEHPDEIELTVRSGFPLHVVRINRKVVSVEAHA